MTLWFGVLKISYHPGKFGGHKHGRGGDIIVLICQVISPDHVKKHSCDIVGSSPSRQATILQNVAAIFASGVTMILVCHVISQDHVKSKGYVILWSPPCQVWRP